MNFSKVASKWRQENVFQFLMKPNLIHEEKKRFHELMTL